MLTNRAECVFRVAASVALVLTMPCVGLAGPSPAAKCQVAKNKTVGDYYACRAKADAKGISKAAPPDYAKCSATFDAAWSGAETAAAGACPDNVALTAQMNAFIAAQTTEAASVIAGASIPECPADLATCEAVLATTSEDLSACLEEPICGNGMVEAGEDCDAGTLNGATCGTRGFAGGTLACSFCAFDESDCYATRFDASGPTIIDHATGLEWEKKSSADSGSNYGNPHDVDNTYSWSTTGIAQDGSVLTLLLTQLNGGVSSGDATTGCYAGHCDWRLPTIEELKGLPWPAPPEFQPVINSTYWSLSSDVAGPGFAWNFSQRHGPAILFSFSKTNYNWARAVRTRS